MSEYTLPFPLMFRRYDRSSIFNTRHRCLAPTPLPSLICQLRSVIVSFRSPLRLPVTASFGDYVTSTAIETRKRRMLARRHQGSVAEECRLFDARLLINVGLLALPRRSCSLLEFHQVPRMLRKLNVPNECWLDTIFDREFARATRAHARTRARACDSIGTVWARASGLHR